MGGCGLKVPVNPPPDTFQVMAKPSGASCNLQCQYCFYLDKEHRFSSGGNPRMTEGVLATYVRQQIEFQRGSPVNFTWQGGEPTLLGVDFFENAVALQRRYAGARAIVNTFQTNGTFLDDTWGRFLKRENFLVGLSLDGPAPLHDLYRTSKGGQATFDQVMRGLQVLKKHGVEFNILTVVHRESALQPSEVYRFLKQAGGRFLQFIPLVERLPAVSDRERGLRVAPPTQSGKPNSEGAAVSPWSVRAEDYGEFLMSVFDEWVTRDVGRIFVQLFDTCLGIWMGQPASLCLFREKCGDAVVLEPNGDVFSCDHFVYPEYRIGNLLERGLGDLVRSPPQRAFGDAKSGTLPRQCRTCDVRFACQGECPKNRFLATAEGEPGLNYLCAAYQRFFHHVNPSMRIMAYLALNRRPPAEIMSLETERCGTPVP
jgi:uncharacterized protein